MSVLYATDGFPSALDAGRAIERWFDPMKIDVTVVSVTHHGSLAPKHLVVQLDDVESRRGDSVEIVEAAVDRLRGAGIEATPEVAEGHPGREIVGLAERSHHDLVVVGASSHSWLKRHTLGSVSNYILHSAPCSVLVVHELDDGSDDRALVAVDGSERSMQAVRVFGKTFDVRRLKVETLSVASVIAPVFAVVPGVVTTMPLSQEQREESLDLAQRAADDAAGQLGELGFDVEPRVLAGPAGPTIVDDVERGNYDVVAVGARGHGPLLSAVLGSVSDPVARRSRAALVAR